MKGIHESNKQINLFGKHINPFELTPVRKIPYDFSYKFKDVTGKSSKLRILEWQIGALYGNCLNSCDGDEVKTLEKVRKKYLDAFLKTDLHFFLGTTLKFHFVAPNPWLIIGVFPVPHEGVFPVPHERQLALF